MEERTQVDRQKGITDTHARFIVYNWHFWRIIEFLREIRDILILWDNFTAKVETFWDKTIPNSGNIIGQTMMYKR